LTFFGAVKSKLLSIGLFQKFFSPDQPFQGGSQTIRLTI